MEQPLEKFLGLATGFEPSENPSSETTKSVGANVQGLASFQSSTGFEPQRNSADSIGSGFDNPRLLMLHL